MVFAYTTVDQLICCSNLKSLFFFILLICNHYSIATYARNKMIMTNYFVFSTIHIECHLTSNFAPAYVITSQTVRATKLDCSEPPTIRGKCWRSAVTADLLEVEVGGWR